MGLYIQFQRRAIESHAGEPEAVRPPDAIDLEQLQSTTGNQLHYAGVSNGIGTCSDILGLDVLVLTQETPTAERPTGELACAYTVLVRELTTEESASDRLARFGIARLCIELLQPRLDLRGNGITVFEPTGKNTPYTAVI